MVHMLDRNFLLSSVCFLTGFFHLAFGISKDNLFPHSTVGGEEHDEFLTTGGANPFSLTVPIVLYGKKYTSVYINGKGIVTFSPVDVGSPEGRPFPPPFPAIAPYFADIESENDGVISFRESTSQPLLDKANAFIHQAFPDQGAFLAQSVLIATWDDVIGHGNPNHYKNSFQLVVANNGDDSFALFLYPDGALSWAKTTSPTPGAPEVFAQAGFASEDGTFQTLEGSGTDYLRLLPTRGTPEGLQDGVHVYHIGNPVIEPTTQSPDVAPPAGEDEYSNRYPGEEDPAAAVTREPIDDRHPLAILSEAHRATDHIEKANQGQDVPEEGNSAPEQPAPEPADPTEEGPLGNGAQLQQGSPVCQDQSQCHADAQCVPKTGGSCCECRSQYLGNGKLCIDKESAQRMNGQVSGQLNGVDFRDALMHNYIVVNEGRVYVAYSPIPNSIGDFLQTVFPVASIVGWMFATPESGLKNGLQLTGGVFNQTATVRFTETGQTIQVTQRFSGLDQHKMLHSVLHISGNAPSVTPGQMIEVADHQIEYRRVSPGQIHSTSKHAIKFGDRSVPYTVDETIMFDECPYSQADDAGLAEPVKLHISRIVSLYQVQERASRFGMDAKLTDINSQSQALPEDVCATVNCGPNTGCGTQDGRPVCFCSNGFEARDPSVETQSQPGGIVCSDIDECATRNECSPHAECLNSEGSFTCRCLSGYMGNGRVCKTAEEAAGDCVAQPEICDSNAHCQRNERGESLCVCHPGFSGDGFTCQPSEGVTQLPVAPPGSCYYNPAQCDRNAACVPVPVGNFACQCLDGFEGSGTACKAKPTTRGGFLAFTQGMSVVKLVVDRNSPDRGGQLAIVPGQTAVGITVDCLDSYIYWSDISEHTINRARYDGADVEAVIRNAASVEGLAIDHVSRNIFWTDSANDHIAVAKLTDPKAGHKVLIKKDLSNPRAIAVHPSRGTIYWTDWNRQSPKIESASMDGTDRRVLVQTDLVLPNALAVDYQMDDLCWADAGNQKVECISLEGNNRRLIHIGAAYPFGMTMHENRLYWTDWKQNNIMSVSKNGADAKAHELPVGSSGKVYGISSVPDQCPRLTNACAAGNGGCRYICLPMPGGRQQCVCPDGISADQCS